jgi:hypothetical protein
MVMMFIAGRTNTQRNTPPGRRTRANTKEFSRDLRLEVTDLRLERGDRKSLE